MIEANKKLRILLFTNDIKICDLADCMGIHPVTLSRKLRKELSVEDYNWILRCIELILSKQFLQIKMEETNGKY